MGMCFSTYAFDKYVGIKQIVDKAEQLGKQSIVVEMIFEDDDNVCYHCAFHDNRITSRVSIYIYKESLREIHLRGVVSTYPTIHELLILSIESLGGVSQLTNGNLLSELNLYKHYPIEIEKLLKAQKREQLRMKFLLPIGCIFVSLQIIFTGLFYLLLLPFALIFVLTEFIWKAVKKKLTEK